MPTQQKREAVAEIKEKFRQSAQDLVDPDATAQAIALLEQLEDLDDMSRLTGLLGQPGQAAA